MGKSKRRKDQERNEKVCRLVYRQAMDLVDLMKRDGPTLDDAKTLLHLLEVVDYNYFPAIGHPRRLVEEGD